MNWDAIGAIAELFGAVGVIASLVYLAVQIRQNTRTVKVSSYQQLVSQIQQGGFIAVQDPDAAQLMGRAYREYEELPPEQRAQAAGFLQATFVTFQSHHYMYRQGLLDDDMWAAHRENLRRTISMPGPRAWWDAGIIAFSEPFVHLINELIEESSPGGA